MKNISIALVVVCSLLMSSCTTLDLNTGTNGKADVSVYYFEETGQLDRSDTRNLIENYLASDERDIAVNSSNILVDDKTAYFVSKENVNNTMQHDLATGNFTYNRMGKYMGNFKPDLPSPDRSEQLVAEFLKRNEIYPAQSQQLKLVHQGGLRSATVDANNQRHHIIDKTITLYYGRMVDGLNVIGPGSKIVAQVGDGGQIVGLIKRWREIARKDSISQSQLFTEKEARRQAEKQIVQEYGNVEHEIFNTITAYYDNNGSTLQPVYGFEVKISPGQELETIEYLCVIPMMKNPAEKLNLRQLDPQALEMIRKMGEDEDTGEAQGRVD